MARTPSVSGRVDFVELPALDATALARTKDFADPAGNELAAWSER